MCKGLGWRAAAPHRQLRKRQQDIMQPVPCTSLTVSWRDSTLLDKSGASVRETGQVKLRVNTIISMVLMSEGETSGAVIGTNGRELSARRQRQCSELSG